MEVDEVPLPRSRTGISLAFCFISISALGFIISHTPGIQNGLLRHAESEVSRVGLKRLAEGLNLCEGGHNAKWVVYNAQGHNEEIADIAVPTSWNFLIVEGDNATEFFLNLKNQTIQNVSNTVFLSDTRQKLIRSYLGKGGQGRTRRQLGYLYAILCGAELIYDAHSPEGLLPDSEILFGEGTFPQTLGSNGLHILNPYAMFGHPDVLPRPALVQEQEEALYEFRKLQRHKKGDLQQPLVQIGVGNICPNGSLLHRGDGDLHGHPKGAAVMPGIFAMLPERPNIIVHKKAFWGLPLLQLQDTANGWFAFQRLLWVIHGQVLVSRPVLQNAVFGSAHSFSPEFMERGEELVKLLVSWKEGTGALDEQIAALLQILVSEGFLDHEQMLVMGSWLDDLKSVGYEFQKTVTRSGQLVSQPTKILAAFCFSGQMDRASRAIPETLRSLQRLLTGSSLIPEVGRLMQTVQHSVDVEGTVTFDSDVFAYLSTHESCPEDVKWMSQASFTYGIMYNDPAMPEFPFDLGPELLNGRFGYNRKTPMLYQMHGQQRCFEMVQEYARQHNREYMVVVRLRSDHTVLSMTNLSDAFAFWTEESMQKVTIPQPAGDWPSIFFPEIGGYQDRIGWGPPRYMQFYMTRWSQFFNETHYNIGGPYHGESSLRYALDSRGIPVRRIQDNDFVYRELDDQCSKSGATV